MGAIERLEALGLQLPPVPVPAAAYQPYARSAATVFTAGQLPTVEGELVLKGRLGEAITTEQGAELARLAACNLLAIAAEAAGELDRVRVTKVTVFVASTPDFTEQHLVADGASNLFGEVLGEHGRHARSAVGVAALPMGAPVEVESVLEVLPR